MRYLALAIVCITSACADYLDITPAIKGPWFTGPLLTPSAYTIPEGHFNIQPYIFVDNIPSVFNEHWHSVRLKKTFSDINLQVVGKFGLSSFMDLTIIPSFFYNYVGDESSWRFGDLFIGTSFQLFAQSTLKGFTAKVGIAEVFPTGVYEHLNPKLLGTDASGDGTFSTIFKFVLSKRWNPYSIHYLQASMSTSWWLSSKVEVHGLNSYGGGEKTIGRVLPGAFFPLLLGFEYNLTQNWVLALDIANTIKLKTKFKGYTEYPVGLGFAYSLTVAPAIEYNFSDAVGLIGGVWVSLKGRNARNHLNYVLSLNWYH